ncbi:hypothetical protein ACFL09_02585 [Planctomycetota bacterium]
MSRQVVGRRDAHPVEGPCQVARHVADVTRGAAASLQMGLEVLDVLGQSGLAMVLVGIIEALFALGDLSLAPRQELLRGLSVDVALLVPPLP